MEIKQQLYFVEMFRGYASNSKLEKYIYQNLDFDNQIVTEKAKRKILDKIIDLHNEFIKNNPRARKDKDYKYEFKKMGLGIERIVLSTCDVPSHISFYPKKIWDFNPDNLEFFELDPTANE